MSQTAAAAVISVIPLW